LAKEPLEFPQITDSQMDIWLVSPVTKAYLRCLKWKADDQRDAVGTGVLVDSSNADMTHALIHRALGQRDGFAEAGEPEKLLDFYKMIFRPPPPEEEKEAADG
jgi:hypothetical protein